MKFVKARYSGIEWWGLKFRRMGEVKSIFWWRDLGCLDISEVNKYGWLSKSARSLNLFLEESLRGATWNVDVPTKADFSGFSIYFHENRIHSQHGLLVC